MLLVLAVVSACTGSSSDSPGPDGVGCPDGGGAGAVAYDISKSRFAFGGKPSMSTDPGGDVTWSGPDGGLTISPSGLAGAQLHSDAPENDLPPATTDFATEVAYARDYFATMGIPGCQVEAGSYAFSLLQRVVQGVSVVESVATARFDSDNTTTSEELYWPAIPASVVMAAVAFHEKLMEPKALDAYKRKLPRNAQGSGQVVIHHSDPAAAEFSPFASLTTYDVITIDDAGSGNANLSFDVDGNAVTLPWS